MDQVNQAIEVGFSHIDTARGLLWLLHPPMFIAQISSTEYYGNEQDAGVAIRESGLSREDIWITTKVCHPTRRTFRLVPEKKNTVVWPEEYPRIHLRLPV